MIRFADEGMRGQLRELWSACFGDSNAYVDLYFEQHDAARHTMVFLDGDHIASMLSLLPMTVVTQAGILPARYVYAVATLPSYQLLVRMEAVCICGSDLHAIRGDQPLFSFPRVIGHEAAGRVAEVGEGVRGFSVGDQVCLMPCIPCGTCRACQRGRTNACARLNLYGVHQDGGLQEYLAAPAQNWLKTDRPAPAQEIAMLEPLTIGAHAAAKLELAPGDRVLVTGAGPIGISCALNAQTYGARVLLSDTNPGRRAFAAERFRLLALDPLDEHFTEQTAQFTEDSLFDAVIDTTAAKASMEQTWRWIGQGGKIVFVGICGGTLELDGLRFHLKEPSLFVTRRRRRR